MPATYVTAAKTPDLARKVDVSGPPPACERDTIMVMGMPSLESLLELIADAAGAPAVIVGPGHSSTFEQLVAVAVLRPEGVEVLETGSDATFAARQVATRLWADRLRAEQPDAHQALLAKAEAYLADPALLRQAALGHVEPETFARGAVLALHPTLTSTERFPVAAVVWTDDRALGQVDADAFERLHQGGYMDADEARSWHRTLAGIVAELISHHPGDYQGNALAFTHLDGDLAWPRGTYNQIHRSRASFLRVDEQRPLEHALEEIMADSVRGRPADRER